MMRANLHIVLLLLAALVVPAKGWAQGSRVDTLSVGVLHAAAAARDPGNEAPAILRASHELRDQLIAGERFAKPQLNAQATHQSDVTQVPLREPGSGFPTPPYTRYQLTLDLDQPLYDAGSVRARRAVERKRLGEAEAEVAEQLYRRRFDVNAALFSVLLHQEQLDALEAADRTLGQRLDESRLRVREGVALSRDTSLLAAERLRLEESRAEITSRRRAAVAVLNDLTGRRFDPDRRLFVRNDFATPTVSDTVANIAVSLPMATTAAMGPEGLERERPEFARFDAMRARLVQEAEAAAVESRPRVSAFMQAGVGQPGLNQLRPDADAFYIAGVRATWRPFARADAQRRAEQFTLQQRIADLEERAFAEALERSTRSERAEIAMLEATVTRDRAVIAMRGDVERVARLEFDEGASTAAAWVTAQNDLLSAHITARRHAVELAHARVRLLTLLGLPIP